MEKQKFAYQRVYEYLLDIIAKNRNQPDIRLPSENWLAAKFRVSRLTARKAILLLRDEGLLYRKQGKGTFTRGDPLAAVKRHLSRAGRNGMICIFLPNFESPFIWGIIQGCSDFLSGQGEQLFICCAENRQSKEVDAIRKAIEKGARGFIVFPVNGETLNRELFRLALGGFPIVFIDRILRGFDISTVCTDHSASSFEAVEYLIAGGRKNTGLILPALTGVSSSSERLQGYEKALMIHGLPVNKNAQLFLTSQENNRERIVNFLEANPGLDSILSIGGWAGLDLYRAVRDLKRRVPQDLSIIFFDNEYAAFQDLLPFRPTMIVQEAYTIGKRAAAALLELLENPAAGITRALIPSHLIPGGSTGPAGETLNPRGQLPTGRSPLLRPR